MEQREVVVALAFPANEEAAEAIVPRVGALHHPAPGLPADATEQRRLALAANVRRDAADADGRFGVRVVVPLVETDVRRATRAARGPHDDVVEHFADQPFVVHIGAGDARGHRDPTAVGQDVPFYAAFRPVRRIRSRVVPPVGAFTVALSSEVQCHWMPRRAS